MSKSVKKNYIYNMLFQILKVAMPILTAPYIARTLGAQGNGIYGFTISIVTYFILIGGIGIDLYGQREIAFVQDNKKERSRVFWELFLLKLITMSISMVTFFFVFGIQGEYQWYYRILLLEMLANLIDVAWFFQGIEDFKKTAIRNIIVKLLSVASIFLFVKTENDVWIYLFIYALTTLFGALVLWPSLRKKIERPKNLQLLRHLKPVLVIFLPQIAVQVYTVLDKTMVGWLTGDMNEVGYYEQSQKIIRILLALITSLGTVMMPRIAHCYQKKDHEGIKKYIRKSFRFVLASSIPLLMGLVVVSPRFVPIFFGPGYDKVVGIMQIMSMVVLFIGLSNIIGIQFLLPTKRQKEYTISILSGTFTNVIMNFIFIPWLKSYGAAIATVIAECVVLLTQIWFSRKDLPHSDIVKIAIRYFIYGLVMAAVCIAVGLILPDNVMGLCGQVAVGALMYGSIIFFTKDPIFTELTNTIFHRHK